MNLAKKITTILTIFLLAVVFVGCLPVERLETIKVHEEDANSVEKNTSPKVLETYKESHEASLAGEIKLLGPANVIETETYDDNFVVYGEVLGMEEFSVKFELNGAEVRRHTVGKSKVDPGNGLPFLRKEGVDYSRFHFNFNELSLGVNIINISLHTNDDKNTILDEKIIKVNRLKTKGEEVIVEIIEPQEIDTKSFFEDMLEVDLDKDEAWRYINYISLYENGHNKESFLGQNRSSSLSLKDIKKIGKIYLEKKNYPIFLLQYIEPDEYDSRSWGTIIIGYIQDSKFYYFTNAYFYDGGGNAIKFYIKPSPYILLDTIVDLETIKIENSEDELIYNGNIRICLDGEINEKEIIFNHGSYNLYPRYILMDKYGLCSSFIYQTPYFKDEEIISQRNKTHYYKLDINFDDNREVDMFYNPFRNNCGGSYSYWNLPSGHEDYLEKVGTTSAGQDVFIFSKDTPVLEGFSVSRGDEDLMFIPKSANEDEKQWSEFLEELRRDYIVLVIKNDLGDWMVFVREDYVYYPDC